MVAIQNIEQAKVQIREMLKAEKYPQVRLFASQLLKQHGADAELLYLRGTACARRDANEQAVKDLRAAVALQPQCIDYYLALSNALFTGGRFEAALIEYIRVRKFAAGHPRVRGYGSLINPRTGKLKRAIDQAEAVLDTHPDKPALVNRLAALYFVSAIFHWHVRQHKQGLTFFATSLRQIDQADAYLDKLKALPLHTNTVKTNRSKLDKLIRAHRRRRFDGFSGDILLAVCIGLIGFGTGGFSGLWYAFSALASFAAFRRPGYVFNQRTAERPKTLRGRLEFILDMVYAAHINETHPVFGGIPDRRVRALTAESVRALLRTAVMPVSVLAGFYTNYSVKHAAAFLVASVGVAWAFSI